MSDQLKNTNEKNSTLNFLDLTDENFLSEALKTYGKYIAGGLMGLLLLVILFYRLSSSHTVAEEKDYREAANAFAMFVKTENSPQTTEKAFNELTSLIKSYPELKAVYDGMIAQTLLNRAETTKALPFAEETIKRVKINHLDKYTQFASNTLLISEQKYQEALNLSLKLQEEMEKEITTTSNSSERQFGDELFAINLFRVAILQSKLGDKEAELKTWNLWKEYAALGKNPKPPAIKVNSDAFRSVMQKLMIGNLSLADYITYRENI